jgi:hypothetical protein
MKSLTTTLSCGAVAVLCSGCLPPQALQQIKCTVLKEQFNDFQAKAKKGEVMLGAKVYETEAEIKEALKSNIEFYGAVWKEESCPGSLKDPD